MYVPCECDNKTFYLRFEFPLNVFAECTECGEEREIGKNATEGGEPYA